MKRSWNTAMEATLILVWVAGSAWATPVGTAFTYQGQLKQAGVPVNDSCAMVMILWNDPVASLGANAYIRW